MKITSVSHERTYNTGNYTSQRFGISADLEAGDDPEVALIALAVRLDYIAQKAISGDYTVNQPPMEMDS